MTRKVLGSLAALLAGVGLTFGQSPAPFSAEAPVLLSADPEANMPATWSRAEYLLGWIKDGPVPGPLAVRGGSFAPGSRLGSPGTNVILGNKDLDYGTFSGLRVGGGSWLDADRLLGIEANVFVLEHRSVVQSLASDAVGNPILSRPFLNANTGQAAAWVISKPGEFSGSLTLNSHSQNWGAEINGRINLLDSDGLRVDALGGFRYLGLEEALVLDQRLSFLTFGPGTTTSRDRFFTLNNFFGGQVGAEAEFSLGGLFVNIQAKVALGSTTELVKAAQAGLLVLPTNNNNGTHAEFAVAPEVLARLGYQLGDHCRAFVGYDFLYWSNVARPGKQIDLTINPTQLTGVLVGPPRPAFLIRQSDYWAQGLNFGLELRF